MKKRTFAALAAGLGMILSSVSVYASASATSSNSHTGTYYEETVSGITCIGEIGSTLKTVSVSTARSGLTVMVTSKAYPSIHEYTNTIGSGGNASNSVTFAYYTATATIAYIFQEHSTPTTGTVVTEMLTYSYR